MGEDGAGHYVKMIHNGIEYIDMQLIGEAYFLLRNLLHISAEELSRIFASWNQGDLDSYLIEITADILKQRDPERPDAFHGLYHCTGNSCFIIPSLTLTISRRHSK